MDRLPDTPWHIGYTKKDEDDPRRHKSRCIHNANGECVSPRSKYYMDACGGSSHCGEYAETEAAYKKLLKNRKTADEIERDSIEKYKESLTAEKRKLAKADKAISHKQTSDLFKCLVCNEGLNRIKKTLKKCPFCGMYYVNIEESTEPEILDIVKADDVFLMHIQRKTEKKNIPQYYVHDAYGICKFMDEKGKCNYSKAKKFRKSCPQRNCKCFKT